MPETPQDKRQFLARFLPEEAVEPIFQFLTVDNKVKLVITSHRNSKLGDYRRPSPQHPFHQITLNGDLNPYMFLWVLLHEMAHLNEFKRHGARNLPHGKEWKEAYNALILQYKHIFPEEIQHLLLRYANNIPPVRTTEDEIERRLFAYDPPSEVETSYIKDIPFGSTFLLMENDDPRVFQLIEKRRTRYLCIHIETGNAFTVQGGARVFVLTPGNVPQK